MNGMHKSQDSADLRVAREVRKILAALSGIGVSGEEVADIEAGATHLEAGKLQVLRGSLSTVDLYFNEEWHPNLREERIERERQGVEQEKQQERHRSEERKRKRVERMKQWFGLGRFPMMRGMQIKDLAEFNGRPVPSPKAASRPAFPAEPDWYLAITADFTKATTKIDRKLQGRILEAINHILSAPVKAVGDTVKPLTGDLQGLWRYRLGDYRLLYKPDLQSKRVYLLTFAPRGSVYES